MTVERTDESAYRIIRRFMQAQAEGDEIPELLDAIEDIIKSTGRLGGEDS